MARTAASGTTRTAAPENAARSAARRVSRSKQPREIVVVGVVDVIGLGRREDDAVDPPRQDGGEPARLAGTEGGEHVGERRLKIAERRRPGIQRREHVDQHDLPVEPREVIAEERLHHMRLIRLVAPLHHGGERRLLPVPVIGGNVERREGQRR